MKVKLNVVITIVMAWSTILSGQENKLEQLEFLSGSWSGKGIGYGNNRSVIQSEFRYVMNGTYLEAMNQSNFESSDSNPDGEVHIDKGFMSFDKERNAIVYRQFHGEGYINQYVLNDALSGDSMLVFETESIENFAPGGRARYTIIKHSETEIETIFDVSFPGSDFACFGTNKLYRDEK